MSKSQKTNITPPHPSDDQLKGYTNAIQNNIRDLYNLAHDHQPKTFMPVAADGQVGDLRVVFDGTNYFLACKITKDQWAITAALTLL